MSEGKSLLASSQAHLNGHSLVMNETGAFAKPPESHVPETVPANNVHAKKHIVIVGGGFSGATFATLLMRDRALTACDVTVVEPRVILGAGIAYSAEEPAHRVNITAERMAALPDVVSDFDTWIKQSGFLDQDPDAVYPERGIFPARALFGLYVDDLLRQTAAAASHIGFHHVQTRVEAVTKGPGRYLLECASGAIIEADILVLATGHPAPRLPRPLSQLADHRALIVNPWVSDSIDTIKPSDRVLIVGTGLTMGDIVASLRGRGHQAPLTAISRHGLTPRPRSAALNPIEGLSFIGEKTLSWLLHAIRREAKTAKAEGKSWSDVFDILRQQNSAIYTNWSLEEKRRFQRHLRAYWDVHRFQAAPQIHDLVTREQAAGSLTVFAAAMTKAEIIDGKVAVTLRRRGHQALETYAFDAIINCTGATGPLIEDSRLLTSLADAGLIGADALGSGIDVDASSQAKHPSTGTADASLFVLGPAIRGCLGEISGALEIATHVQRVTKLIVSRLRERQAIEV
jgi:uncharacterized NAD(P)/FAD-binding protein YdhS